MRVRVGPRYRRTVFTRKATRCAICLGAMLDVGARRRHAPPGPGHGRRTARCSASSRSVPTSTRAASIAGSTSRSVTRLSTRAPASGEVTFAGSLPTYGATVTIATAGGYRATPHAPRRPSRQARRAGVRGAAARRRRDVGRARATRSRTCTSGSGSASDDDYVDPLSLLPPRAAANPPPAPAAPPASPPPPSQAAPIDQSAASGSAAPAPTAPQPTSARALDGSGAQAEPAGESSALPGLTMTASASRDASPALGCARCGARPTPLGRRAAQDVAQRALGSRWDVTRTRRRTRVTAPASRLARTSAARDSPSRDLVARPTRPSASRRAPIPSVSWHEGAASAQQLRRAATLDSPTPRAAARRGTHALERWWILALAGAFSAAAIALAATARARRAAGVAGGRLPIIRARDRVVAYAEEDPRRGRVAVCERSAAHRPCGGLRRPLGHVRPLPPAPRQRRAHGEWNRRARDARHGRGGRRGRVAA